MTDTNDDVAWVRRVNSRWIVREGLRGRAAAYLDFLAATDTGRLRRSCRRARRLTDHFGDDEDPKPWFYAGLFSLASGEEAAGFLTEHPFTFAALAGHEEAARKFFGPDVVAKTTWRKILRIREGLRELALEESGIRSCRSSPPAK